MCNLPKHKKLFQFEFFWQFNMAVKLAFSVNLMLKPLAKQ